MNELVIPLCPNWYETSMLACTADNTLIYGAKSDIIIVRDTPKDIPADVHVISKAHPYRVISVCTNRNYGQPNKLAVSLGEEKVVKLWDLETLEKKGSHNVHVPHEKVVGAVFAGDDRVISVSENGIVVVWNILTNQTTTLSDIFTFKVSISCLTSCPHATWLAAFGLKTGLVVVVDLRKNGRILYKLRGHDKPVVSFAWCPVPINIFPKNPNNYVGNKQNIKSSEKEDTVISENKSESTQAVKADVYSLDNTNNLNKSDDDKLNSKIINKKDGKINKHAINVGKKKGNLWTNLKYPDDIKSPKQEDLSSSDQESDFLKECRLLKKDILSNASSNDSKKEMEIKDSEDICSRPKLLPTRKHTKTLDKERDVESTEESKETEEKVDVQSEEKDAMNDGPTETVVLADVKTEETHDKSKSTDASKETGAIADVQNEDKEVKIKHTETSKEDEDSHDLETNLNSSADSDSSVLNTTVIEVEPADDEACEKVEVVNGNVSSCSIKHNEIEDKNKTSANGEGEVISTFEAGRKICISEEEEPRKEFLLASSARESNIYIWRAGTDGRLQTFLTVPKSSKNKNKNQKAEKLWIALCWPSPKILLSSSRNAELIEWTLPKPKDSSKEYRIIHKDHYKQLFNIVSPIKFFTAEDNWNEETHDLNTWSFGQERVLLNTDLSKEKRVLSCYPTLGGGVTTFATSPVDPNRLAFGTTDGIISILDLSRPHTKTIITTQIYQKIQSKVTTLAWHPTQELLLAYGTAEGRVGYVDTSSKSKVPTSLPQFFKNEIYGVEWGPLDNTPDLGLYATSEGKLVTYSLKSSNEEAKEFDLPDSTSVYSFSWKPDFSFLFVVSKAGTLLKYDKDFNLLGTMYLQHKLQQITWHPDATISDTNVSKHCNRFAAVVRNTGCYVYDVSKDPEIIFKIESKKLISEAAWSPHAADKLVVAFDEGFANVYNVESGLVLSTFVSSSLDNMLSVIWSPANTDLIITGLANKLQIWNINKYPPVDEEVLSEKRKVALKALNKESSNGLPKLKDLHEDDQIRPAKKNSDSKTPNMLPVFYSADVLQGIKDTKKLLNWKQKSENVEVNAGDNKYIDILQVFGKNSEMTNVLNMNETSLKQRGKYKLSTTVSLFKGDIVSCLKEAIDQKRVDPFIISLCPMVSPKLWQSACETYAQQLRDKSDPLEAASYLLALHKVEEAIDVLCENSMYKEALALAKSRLQEGDSAIPTILEKWAKYLQYTGNFEMAANCYICIDKYEEAAMTLFRRSDIDVLQLAKEIADKSGNEELIKAIMLRYNVYKQEADKLKQSEDKKENELTTKLNGTKNNNSCDSQIINHNGETAEEKDITGYTKDIDNKDQCEYDQIFTEIASEQNHELNGNSGNVSGSEDHCKYIKEPNALHKFIENLLHPNNETDGHTPSNEIGKVVEQEEYVEK